MSNLSDYYIKNKNDLTSKRECMVIGQNYRFTILTERLIRLEYSVNGTFENRSTQNVIFRNFERPIFVVNETDALLQISTKYFNLSYVKNKPFESSKLTPGTNLKVDLRETNSTWYYGHPEARNLDFGTIKYSLDDFVGKLELDKGLYSTDGFCILDDSTSLVLNEDGEYTTRNTNNVDIYLFMYKRDFGLCLKDYYDLTGYPAFIPRYTLGNWWYKNDLYNYNDIVKLLKKFNDNNIPLSVIMLGDKWHNNIDNYSFDDNIIDSKKLISLLHSNNIKLGLTINPSLPIDKKSPYYEEISKYIKGKEISFIPLTMPKLGIYFNTFTRRLSSMGVDLFNIDYNNINDRNNLWLFNHFHYVDNIITRNKRGVILSRNSKMATHRYPITYTGKTIVDWNTLNALPSYNMSAANSGISFVAHAIGGYYKGIEQEELFMRYVQFATFSPFLILAGDEGKYYKREPWKWNGLRLLVIREYMQLRNKLVPYIYTESYNYYKKCVPLIQPLYYKYGQIADEPLYRNQYFFGSEMLICPITKKKNPVINRVVQRIFIPEGVWFDLKTGKKYPGDKYYMCFYKDDEYPAFCKAGSIIPLSLNDSTDNPTDMEIVIFPGNDNSYIIYEDDGISNNYTNGDYMLTRVDYKYKKDNYSMLITNSNKTNIVPKRNYKIRFKNTVNITDVNVLYNNKQYEASVNYEVDDFIVEVKDVASAGQLFVNIRGQNIELSTEQLINDDIREILNDLEIETTLKYKIDEILFSNLSIKQKRIEIKKLKKNKLEPKFITMFMELLEHISSV